MRNFLYLAVAFSLFEISINQSVPCDEMPKPTEKNKEFDSDKHFLAVISLVNSPVFIERNISGTVVKWFGPPVEMLHQLSIMYNFRYFMKSTTETTIEKSGDYKRGLADYLKSGEADVLIGAAVIIASRYRVLDFTQPWDQGSVGILIPRRPSNILEVNALLKPLQLPIWIALLLSGIAVVVAMCTVQSTYKVIDVWKLAIPVSYSQIRSFSNSFYHVLCVLLGQGGSQSSNKLAVNLIIGAWCLAACVLVNIYSSTLTTFLITYKPPAIVKNVNDLAQNGALKLLVHQGAAVDSFLSTGEDKLYKKLNQKVNSYPQSRCANRTKCVDRVKQSHSMAYFHGKDFLLDVIGRDFKRTGKCQLELAKEDFSQFYVSFALAKRSRYTEYFNIGMLRLVSKGLVICWKRQYLASAHHCLGSTNERSSKNHRLSFRNLSAAFGILLIGSVCSVITFIFEHIFYRFLR